MKKIVSLVLAAVLGVSLYGCAENKPAPLPPAKVETPADKPAPDAAATPAPEGGATPAPEGEKK